MKRDNILSKISRACDGLVYISETDAPFSAFLLENATEETLEKTLSRFADRPDDEVEETDLDTFFQRLTAEKDWHGEVEKERVKKFQALKQTLEHILSGLRVFRIGRIRRDIFIVGVDKDSRRVGVRTQSVET